MKCSDIPQKVNSNDKSGNTQASHFLGGEPKLECCLTEIYD